MNNSAPSTVIDQGVPGSESSASSNPWRRGSTKRDLQRLRARLRETAEVAAFAKISRQEKRSWPDLLFAAATIIGGVALVVHGAGRNFLELLGASFMLVVGLSCVSSLTHESWHTNLSANKPLNDFISRWILSPLLVADFEIQQENHLLHHAYLGEDADPDGHLYRMSTRDFVRMLVGRAIVIPYVLKLAGFRKEACTNGNAPRLISGTGLFRILVVQGTWLTTIAAGAWWGTHDLFATAEAVLFGYFLPLMLASFLIAIRGHREHYVDEATARTITCDTDCIFIERWLVAGGQFNWHVCHHLFPEIPQRLLPGFAAVLRKHTELMSYYGAPAWPVAARGSYLSSSADPRCLASRPDGNSSPVTQSML
jgi:fatty acid desaturase